jgi:hypothetical protein
MSGDSPDDSIVEKIAWEMLARDGAYALRIARQRAELEEALADKRSAAIWEYIADAIDRLNASRIVQNARSGPIVPQ